MDSKPAEIERLVEERFQQMVDRSPEPLRRLGERLADMLSEDDWNNVEPYLLNAAASHGVWRPIETAPRDGTRILTTDGAEIATAEFTNGRWIVSPTAWEGDGDRGGLQDLDIAPTHWQIPELPRP